MSKLIPERLKDKVAKGSLKLFLASALTMGYIMIQIDASRKNKVRY